MTEPIHAVTNADTGQRFYEHPTKLGPDGQPERFISVTTALEAISKGALKFWAAQGTAGLSMGEIPRLIKAARLRDCEKTRTKQACQECRPCVEYWLSLWHYREGERAKRRGSRIHKYVEHWIRHGVWPVIEEQDQPYVDAFKQFIADYGLTPKSWLLLECTVIDRAHNCGGTLDGAIRFEPITEKAAELCARFGRPDQPVVLLDDIKSREKPEPAIYPESALQLSGYRYAPLILLPDGSEEPMIDTDGAIVLQLRGNGAYTCRPVDTSEQTYTAFLNAMWVSRWLMDCGPQAVQVGSFPIPEGWEPQIPEGVPTPVRKRAKVQKKAATPAKKATPTAVPASPSVPSAATRAAVLPAALRPTDGRSGQVLTDDEIPF